MRRGGRSAVLCRAGPDSGGTHLSQRCAGGTRTMHPEHQVDGISGDNASFVSSGLTECSGALIVQSSRTITWIAPAIGMAKSTATKPPKKPPTQSPMPAPTKTLAKSPLDRRVLSGAHCYIDLPSNPRTTGRPGWVDADHLRRPRLDKGFEHSPITSTDVVGITTFSLVDGGY
jgi:hypothetical protein